MEVYAELPVCSDTVPAPCRSTEATVALLKADEAANTTLEFAQTVVRSESVMAALKQETAQNAMSVIRSFEALLIEIGAKPEG